MKSALLLIMISVVGFAEQSVTVQTGGFRVRAPQLKYYFESVQETLIEYTNPLLADGTKVQLEFAVPKSRVDEDKPQTTFDLVDMVYEGNDRWSYRFESLRHGLGSNWMTGRVLFFFHATPPGKKTVKIDCEDDDATKGVFSAEFAEVRDLPWRVSSEPFTLGSSKVSCETEF